MSEKNVKNVLEVRDLCTYFFTDNGVVKSVDGLSFDLQEGSTLGIVGESGSGKSVTALAIMDLLRGTTGRVVNGSIKLDGRELTELSAEERRLIRGKEISMIFQEPMTSLNPVMKIGDQIAEAIVLHQKVSKEEAKKLTLQILKDTGLPRAESMMNEYPFQLSGGQRQRVMIAMGLVCHPRVLIADEPTTALDVTIQAQILDLMARLKEEYGTSILFITHSLGVVAEICDHVLVMYCSRAMESGTVEDIFKNPKHPYTRGLMHSIPKLGEEVDRLYAIPGNVPNPKYMPKGCKFAPRCEEAMDICMEEEPPYFDYGDGHLSRCWRCSKRFGGEIDE